MRHSAFIPIEQHFGIALFVVRAVERPRPDKVSENVYAQRSAAPFLGA